MGTLLDGEFEDFEEEAIGLGADKPEKPKELVQSKEDGIEVVIEDDTPEGDRGRPTADNMPVEDDDDEAAAYSKNVQNRIRKETAKMHAERRAKEDRERQLNEATERMRTLIRENNALKEMVEGGEKVLISEHTGRLQGEIEAAKVAYREAHDAGDPNGMAAAQEVIAKASAKLMQAESHRTRALPRIDEAEVDRLYKPVQQPQQPRATPQAAAWVEKNPWFQKDDTMTYVALATHRRLMEENVVPDSEEYYKGIDREMRMRFPDRFKNDQRSEPTRRSNAVAPVSRGGGGGGRTRVTLTESQVRLARRLGLTNEQYASQVAAESGQGEWVHGKS